MTARSKLVKSARSSSKARVKSATQKDVTASQVKAPEEAVLKEKKPKGPSLLTRFRQSPLLSKIIAFVILTILLLALVGAFLTFPYASYGRTFRTINDFGVDSAVVTQAPPSVANSTSQTNGKAKLDKDNSEVTFTIDPSYTSVMKNGDKILIYSTPSAQYLDRPWIFYDFDRTLETFVVILLGVAFLILITRLRGLRTALGLAISLALIAFYTVPTLIAGQNAFLAIFITMVLILYAIYYLIHGINIQTAVALVSSLICSSVAIFCAYFAIGWVKATGTSADGSSLLRTFDKLELKYVFIAGMMIVVVGAMHSVVLNQVKRTAKMASHMKNPDDKFAVFNRSLKRGRENIAGIYYTVSFAYAGTTLSSILWALSADTPFQAKITSSAIVDDILAAVLGVFAVMLVAPLATILTILIVMKHEDRRALSSAPAPKSALSYEVLDNIDPFDGEFIDEELPSPNDPTHKEDVIRELGIKRSKGESAERLEPLPPLPT